METLHLFHTGYQVIENPDIDLGRKNADFGPGFYLSDDGEFSRRWARVRKDRSTYLNSYELCLEGLRVKRFSRDIEWFSFIFANRSGSAGGNIDHDVIIGPIANDTIYDTWGIITSGLLKKEQALRLLRIGPEYTQVVIRTEKAAAALRFMGASVLSADEIEIYRKSVGEEEAKFQEQLSMLLEDM